MLFFPMKVLFHEVLVLESIINIPCNPEYISKYSFP